MSGSLKSSAQAGRLQFCYQINDVYVNLHCIYQQLHIGWQGRLEDHLICGDRVFEAEQAGMQGLTSEAGKGCARSRRQPVGRGGM